MVSRVSRGQGPGCVAARALGRRADRAGGSRGSGSRGARARALHVPHHLRVPAQEGAPYGPEGGSLDHVQISIQGADAELSDAVAGTASYGDKIAAYHYTRELGFPLTVNVVLHRRNLHQVEALIRLDESLGAERIELANTQFYGWAFHNRDALMPTKAQLNAAWQVVLRERARLGPRLEIVWVLPDYHEQR